MFIDNVLYEESAMAAVRLLLHSAETETGFEDGIKVMSAIPRDDSCESDEDLLDTRVVYRILPESLWM